MHPGIDSKTLRQCLCAAGFAVIVGLACQKPSQQPKPRQKATSGPIQEVPATQQSSPKKAIGRQKVCLSAAERVVLYDEDKEKAEEGARDCRNHLGLIDHPP